MAERQVQQALGDAQLAFQKKDHAAVEAALHQAREAAGNDIFLIDRVSDAEIAALVERGEIELAAQRMSDRIAALHKAHMLEHGLHDEMIALCEARGDELCALMEADQMISAAERIPPPWPIRMRLGNLWQRAHTLRAFAETLKGANREAAILYARQAREEFSELARQTKQSLASIEILTEQFAALDGDCPTALKAAHTLDLKSLDPQDLYITSVTLEACGEADNAAEVRKRILANPELRLFPAAYRYLARAKHYQ